MPPRKDENENKDIKVTVRLTQAEYEKLVDYQFKHRMKGKSTALRHIVTSELNRSSEHISSPSHNKIPGIKIAARRSSVRTVKK